VVVIRIALALGVLTLTLPALARAQADTSRVTVSVAGGVVSIDDRSGPAIGGEAAVRLLRLVDVVFAATRFSDIATDDLVNGATTVATAARATAQTTQRARMFEAGARLRVPTGSFAQPYVIIGGGSARVSTATTFSRGGVTDPAALGIQLGRDLDGVATRRTLWIGGGVDLSLGRHIAIDAGVRYSRWSAKPSEVPGDVTRGLLRIQAGAGIRF
jgi:opacity protein-like surface antigen